MRAAAFILLGVLTVGSAAGCGPTVDLATHLQVQLVSTGWLDAGVADGQNKLVPAVSVTLKNLSDQKLPVLQVNALFRRAGNEHVWGSGFITAAGSDGLASGTATRTLLITSERGYTGTDSRLDMLNNSHFIDARVDLFAKYGSTQWTKLGEYPITRQLIAR